MATLLYYLLELTEDSNTFQAIGSKIFGNRYAIPLIHRASVEIVRTYVESVYPETTFSHLERMIEMLNFHTECAYKSKKRKETLWVRVQNIMDPDAFVILRSFCSIEKEPNLSILLDKLENYNTLPQYHGLISQLIGISLNLWQSQSDFRGEFPPLPSIGTDYDCFPITTKEMLAFFVMRMIVRLPYIQNDQDTMIAAMPFTFWMGGLTLGSALRDNVDVMRAALLANKSLAEASPRLRDTKNFVEFAVRNSPTCLEFASARLRDDEDIIRLAISFSDSLSFKAFTLQYASERIRDKEDFIEWAIMQGSDDAGEVIETYYNDILSVASERVQAIFGYVPQTFDEINEVF